MRNLTVFRAVTRFSASLALSLVFMGMAECGGDPEHPGLPDQARTRYFLSLEGGPYEEVFLARGGEAVAEVVTVQTPEGETKQISRLSYRPIELQLSLSMGQPVFDWIKGTLDQSHTYKNGAIIAANHDFTEVSGLDFFEAVIMQVGLPEANKAGQEGVPLTIVIQPEYTSVDYANPELANPELLATAAQSKPKKWLPANFRVAIGNLPAARVSKIEALTIKQKVVEDPVGGMRYPSLTITGIEWPELKVSFSAQDVAPWNAWFEDFAIQGNAGQDQEKTGVIEYLDADGSVLLGVPLRQIGIYSLYQEFPDMRAEMYVEGMTVVGPAPGSAQ